jgi:hypothetical protein
LFWPDLLAEITVGRHLFADTVSITARARLPAEVYIFSPEDGNVFPRRRHLIFRGEASDPHGSVIPDSAFIWSSSLAGKIGVGREIALADPPVGEHYHFHGDHRGGASLRRHGVEVGFGGSSLPVPGEQSASAYSSSTEALVRRKK